MISFEHYLSELQQIQLIQKKLAQKLETSQNFDRSGTVTEVINNLDHMNSVTTSLTKTLSTRQIKHELLTKLNDELWNPFVPIRAYVDMLLSEKFGKLSDEQTSRLIIVNANIRKLEEVINDLLSVKQSLVMNNENENHPGNSQVIKELEQEKLILGKMVQNEEKRYTQLSRKHLLVVAGLIAVIGVVITAYSLFVVQLVGQEYRVPNTGSRNDGYVIQNLSGEQISTWLSWRLVDGTVLHVNVIGADKYPGKLDLIKDVLLSQKAIEIDDSLLGNGPKGSTSTYYTGWGGALAKASKEPTQLYIPTKLDVIESHTRAGDIVIKLTDEQNRDG